MIVVRVLQTHLARTRLPTWARKCLEGADLREDREGGKSEDSLSPAESKKINHQSHAASKADLIPGSSSCSKTLSKLEQAPYIEQRTTQLPR